jgi:hypothetical protein
MNVKFKDGVYGFIWNFKYGVVGEVFTEQLSDKETQLLYRTMHEDNYLIIDEDDIKDCFLWGNDIMDEDEFYNGYKLDKVMELV